MLVLTFFVCTTFSTRLACGQNVKIENKYMLTTPSKYLETASKAMAPEGNNKKNLSEYIFSTEPFEKTTTNTNEDGYSTSTVLTAATHEYSAEICLPGQSAYNKKDLKSIIGSFFLHYNIVEGLNDSFYPQAQRVRKMYTDHLKVFEKRFEDRPLHLKHILEDMAITRQHIQPMVQRIASLLSQYESHEESYYATEVKVNNILEHLEKSKIICSLNCEHEILENLITLTSSRRFLKANHVYCSTFDELIKIIQDRLSIFYIEYSDKLDGRISKDSITFEEKIINIKNKLKTAAVEEFGLTMYEILSLQDEYYHYSIDLKQSNISYVLQNIKQNEYETNSKLLELGSKAKIYRDYCNTCSDRLLYTAGSKPQRLARAVEFEYETLLDEVLNETTNNIQIFIDKQYEYIFADLNRKLDETTIIEAYLSKLTPVKGEIEEHIKRETEIFEHLQSLVPRDSITRVFELADKSRTLLRRIENGLLFIRDRIQ